jgi:hypothetical protein
MKITNTLLISSLFCTKLTADLSIKVQGYYYYCYNNKE